MADGQIITHYFEMQVMSQPTFHREGKQIKNFPVTFDQHTILTCKWSACVCYVYEIMSVDVSSFASFQWQTVNIPNCNE